MTPQERELELLAFWEREKVFEQSVEQRSLKKQYVFYDGPPFATGLPHYGHILGLTSKDLFPRYWTMKGFRVERRWGWDCHGLPIENIAEKALGIKEKKQIEEFGVAKFNEFCRSQVLSFATEWKKTVNRMGKWIEFDHSYKTMDVPYMESVWHIFKTLYGQGSIYEGKKILLYCPRCETPLANAEIAMDNSYKDVTETSATVSFALKEDPSTFILAWTTTPWTLLGNVALAVNPALTYVKIQLGSKKYIFAEDRVQEVVKEPYQVLETFAGKKLVGKLYVPLYAVQSEKKGHYILDGGDQVTATDGTGIVHLAIYGEFDYEMIKKYDLPVVQHVDKHGKILFPAQFAGLWFKKADQKVLEELSTRGLLFSSQNFTHSYPFCYRCETPLFYNALDSWFVNVQSIKQKLLEHNNDIAWHPDHIKDGRFKYILETAPDWCISRNRYWATSIPVWKCQSCSSVTVVGSIKELQKLAIEDVPADVDLHKHVVDAIHFKCKKCKGTMHRIPEVIDCWFESGSMPYAAKHYPFENKLWFKKNFPCDFVSEYAPQVRAWFYYMHVLSVLLFEKAPFKHVVVSGNVLAEDGSKMSKSKGNFPDPKVIFDKYGADALRFYLMSTPLMRAQDLNFSEQGVQEIYRKVVLLLSNVKNFYSLYAVGPVAAVKTKHVLDRWILNRFHSLLTTVTESFDNYDTVPACAAITSFVDDLSSWYVRRSRDRLSEDSDDKKAALSTLKYVLLELSKIIAPVMPFLAEDLYQTLRKQDPSLKLSVHLEVWPKVQKKFINEELTTSMTNARNVVRLALEERNKVQVPIRQVLKSLTVHGVKLKKDLCVVIQDEVNVKKVVLRTGDNLSVVLDTKLTPALEQEGLARELIRRIQDLRKKGGLQREDRIVLYLDFPVQLGSFASLVQQKTGAVEIIHQRNSSCTLFTGGELKGKQFWIGLIQK